MRITLKTTQLIILLSFVVAACSTYPNKFKCGDAKGLGCRMLSEIDAKIDSGEIEKVYEDKKKPCSKGASSANLMLKKQEKAIFNNDEDDQGCILDDDNNLYF